MTLVIIGLLMGLAGLVWAMMMDIVFSDRQSSRRGSSKAEMLLKDSSAPESRAA